MRHCVVVSDQEHRVATVWPLALDPSNEIRDACRTKPTEGLDRADTALPTPVDPESTQLGLDKL